MTTRRIKLSEICRLVEDVDSSDLALAEYDGQAIVDWRVGHADLIDGHHRLAGVCNWALGEGLDLSQVEVEVVDSTDLDEDLVAAAAVPEGYGGLDQDEAIERILES